MKIEEFTGNLVPWWIYPWWVYVGLALGYILLVPVIRQLFASKTKEGEERKPSLLPFVVTGLISTFVIFGFTIFSYTNAREAHYNAEAQKVNSFYNLQGEEKFTYETYSGRNPFSNAIFELGEYVKAGETYSEIEGGAERRSLIIRVNEDFVVKVYRELGEDKLEELEHKE